MKKLVVSLTCGALLIGGLLFANQQFGDKLSLQPEVTSITPTNQL